MYPRNYSRALFAKLLLIVIMISAIIVPVVTTADASSAPKYVFYIIGDGMGIVQRQSAEYYKQTHEGNPNLKLLMNTFPVTGIITTHPAIKNMITDSAAAGTALATGHKTLNGRISKLPDGTNVKTLVEAAEEKGIATGIVTTTRLTHATPAAFSSHNVNRENESEIALDILESGVNFLAGGGYGYFVPQNSKLQSGRNDNKDLLEQFKKKGYKLFVTENEVKKFMNYQPDGRQKIVALFTFSHLPFEMDRVNKKLPLPSLAEITEKGIEVLSQYPEGFLMIVEGGLIDHACHANDAKRCIQETLALDQAIRKAYQFYKEYPEETLIIVLADHETGGMSFTSNREGITWTTTGHTGAQVPVSAIGVESERFGGNKDNTEIAKGLAELLNLNLK